MNRETYRICLTGMPPAERMKINDIISTALVSSYHKNVAVIQEGHASEAAIDAIPTSIKVFIVCGEKSNPVELCAASTVLTTQEKLPGKELFADTVAIEDFEDFDDSAV